MHRFASPQQTSHLSSIHVCSTFPTCKRAVGMSPGRNRTYERWRWQIFSITWLAYAGFYLTRKAFAVAKNELKKPEVMGLTRGDMSWIDGANSVAYALGQFLFGTL